MALLTHTFEPIIECIANIRRHFKLSIVYLTPISIGAIISIIVFSMPLKAFCDLSPIISKIFFLLITISSTAMFIKNSITEKLTLKRLIILFLGILCCGILSYIIRYEKYDEASYSSISILMSGIPLSIALVLPGISFSYMLLYLGLYEKTLAAVQTFDMHFLSLLFISIVFGSYIFSKLLLHLIEKYKQDTYLFVLGFIIISIVDIAMQ